jgi:nucleotide-binding universal stress UspA family protein
MLAVAARICALPGGVLRLVHVRACDQPLPIAGRFYLAPGDAAAVLEEALLMAWGCGRPRATAAVVHARCSDVAAAIAWQAAAWPADLIVLTRHPKLAVSRLVRSSVLNQVMRIAGCPVLAVPPGRNDRVRALRTMAAAGRHGRADPAYREKGA